MHRSHSIYTFQFWLLCLSALLFFASFSMLVPELPDYITKLGGEDYKGLLITLFTVSAALSRPFSGKLADTIGRIPVIFIGILVCILCGFLYPVVSSVLALLALRFVHGFSTGFTPTGNSALIADIVPASRRGEAMGILGICYNIGTAMGPALGSEIATWYGLEIMFYTSGGFALLSGLILIRVKETVSNQQTFKWSLLKIRSSDIFEPRVLAPSIVMMLVVFAFGSMLIIIPDLSKHFGMNKGIFFTYYTLSSVVSRFIAGKTSDKYGRVIVLKYASVCIIISLLFLGFVRTPTQLIIGACLFGLGTGLNSPTIFAWTIDLGLDQFKGRALATLFIALEVGIGLGALLGAYVYQNNISNIPYTFWGSAVLVVFSFLYLQNYQPSKKYSGEE